MVASTPPKKTDKPTPRKTVSQHTYTDRRPFALTTQEWIENKEPDAIKALFCRANPNSVQWTLNLRVADQKTLAGSVQHAWRQNLGVRRNTFFSEPSISITFQSGNIMPVMGGGAITDAPDEFQTKSLPKGLENFYHFVDLLGGKRILDPNGSDRRANVVYITYTSHVYPSIVLAGMFTPEGFSFTDSAHDPNKVEWTANFTIYDSFPRFDNSTALINTWQQVVAPQASVPKSDIQADRARFAKF